MKILHMIYSMMSLDLCSLRLCPGFDPKRKGD
jgi:hypothetical protein